jgi:glycosyltransferase involved in cell wall biosynthesis
MKNNILFYLGDSFVSSQRVGVGTYHYNLMCAITYPFDIILTRSPPKNSQLPPLCNPIIISKYQKIIINVLRYFFPFDWFFKEYKIIITDTTSPIVIKKDTSVFTIVHDLMTITHKKYYTKKSQIWFHLACKSLKRASRIIAVSKTTKGQIQNLLKINESNIVVLPNITNFVVKRGPVSDYFIYIGDMRKNKNLFNTILGFIKYKEKTQEQTKLYICGNKKNEYNNLYALVKEKKMTADILFPGYITETEKIQYFKNAKGMVLLSESEGFGIPVIEALCNNIPTLMSDIPVMHEVASECGIFVKYDNIEEIANGFNQLSHFKATNEFITNCKEIRKHYSLDFLKNQLNNFMSTYINYHG